MHVFLTIDVETYTGDYEADVWAGGLGLGYLVETLARPGFQATFFIEALGARRWGPAGVTRICAFLRDHGHDIQLHLHPVVATAWGLEDRFDRLWAYDRQTQFGLIAESRRLLATCAGEASCAFRAGDLAANDDTLQAMVENGLRIGSNRDLDTRASIASRLNGGWTAPNDLACREGVIDVPVSCFRSPFPRLDGAYRHLQITAAGSGETRCVLRGMARTGYRSAAVLTHPGEFFERTAAGPVPNFKNRRRWEALLLFLQETGWPVRGVREAGTLDGGARPPPPVVRGSAVHAAVRVFQQAEWRLRKRLLRRRSRPA